MTNDLNINSTSINLHFFISAIIDAGGVKPRDWHKNLWELDETNPENNGLQNEDLIVWMRTAALPNFRKLYRKVDHSSNEQFKNGLPAGTYTLDIDYSKFHCISALLIIIGT